MLLQNYKDFTIQQINNLNFICFQDLLFLLLSSSLTLINLSVKRHLKESYDKSLQGRLTSEGWHEMNGFKIV